jgi:aminoglycoside phosphotransferase (APT) family kinase protein
VIRQPKPSRRADLRAASACVLWSSAERCGLDPRGARLIRSFATAAYHLPAADAVARIAPIMSPDTAVRLATSVKVTRWLADTGFPAVEPLLVDQPVIADGYAVTFWRYLAQEGPAPGPADLARLLCKLHQIAPPPVPLPPYRPLVSVRQAIESSHVIHEDERAWLRNRCEELLAAYDRLSFPLPAGIIHGDAWRGNLLRDGPCVVLADWDEVSTGPREIDLVPTLQGTRFGLPEPERDAFIASYGHDIRGWDGYPILREIRELSTTTALLHEGNANKAAQRELQVRLCSIRTGNDQQWTTF